VLAGAAPILVHNDGGLAPGEQAVSNQAQIRDGYLYNRPASVTINGYNIRYEPGLPEGYSGMTQFDIRGFVIGPHAFSSEDELAKTILHETYRLNTSKVASHGTDNANTDDETTDTRSFADRAFGSWGC
jgi:hypothetical protein